MIYIDQKDASKRVVIDEVSPLVEGGRFPVNRVQGDNMVVQANIYADGHDEIEAVLRWKKSGMRKWREIPMKLLGNNRWQTEFVLDKIGRYEYNLFAWIDHFKTWRRDLRRRLDAEQEVNVDLQIGIDLIHAALSNASGRQLSVLKKYHQRLSAEKNIEARISSILEGELAEAMTTCCDRTTASRLDEMLEIVVDPLRARFSAWYEMFPRSCSTQLDWHGTFGDVENRLQYIADMGFNVIYLPPIHPIAQALRKGKNNSTVSLPGDPGSPWAIGSEQGGHDSIHPKLGTFGDFRLLVDKARGLGIDIAIDIAFQTSPEHPFVSAHPDWYRTRPDGTVQYAENPPKKYQDIYPFDFDTADWRNLWIELKSVFEFWIEQGVKIFRVDNPHTKPFRFWEWCIHEVKKKHPEVLFLAEAFTTPARMYHLAKLGFSQSYTYFPWKTTKSELTQYFEEITKPPVTDFFRPNNWTNTPDILHEYLQKGGRPAFMIRAILAATTSASFGIYGPAFELCENVPVKKGSEEYLNSEKYEIRNWDLNQTESIKELLKQLNRFRRENSALQNDLSLTFHEVDNDQILAYSKATEDKSNVILTFVNLDPRNTQSSLVHLRMRELGLDANASFDVYDLLADVTYQWQGQTNYVELNPRILPAHVFLVRRKNN